MASTARLDELKKKFDENPRRYFAPLANEHRKSGDLDQAIALCRTHLPQQPGHISGHIVLAQALFEAGSLDESRDIFHAALGLDPENLIALRYLGDIARDTSDIDTARSWYQRVLEVDPRNDEIVQLVRDLDLPRPAPEPEPEAVEEPVIEDIASFAPPPAAEAPTPASESSDARFAPLSLEEIDLDDAHSVSDHIASQESSHVAQPGSPEAMEVSASWTLPEPSSEPPQLLDTPGMDPFDLDPAGGADSLFDSAAQQASNDLFFSELSGAHAPDDGIESAHSYGLDAWTPEPTSEPAAPAEPTPNELSSFEEGSFYLEPPPAAPIEAAETEPVTSAHGQSEIVSESIAESFDLPAADPPARAEEAPADGGLDAFAAEYYAPVEHHAPAPESTFESVHAEPNAELVESVDEHQTAEWQPPVVENVTSPIVAASHDDLGLEVMEFVPPSSESVAPSRLTHESELDPTVGRMFDMSSTEQPAPPAAFVTETMAELYLQQGFRNEALEVYRELLSRNPGDASLRERIEQIESGSMSSVGMAMVSESVVESAIKRQGARPPRSVRSFFASLASRRAPAPREAASDASDYEAHVAEEHIVSDAPVDYLAPPVEPEAMSVVEPVTAYEPFAMEPPAAAPEEPLRDRITPLISAAETLASFDPFAEASDPSSLSDAAVDLPPNAEPVRESEPLASFAAPAPAPRLPTPIATPVVAPEPTGARKSLEDLFPDAPITPRTEAAAQTLATAFGRQEPQGRPTRAASNELSLDHVFRGSPEGPPPADGGFSFDQFFSDSRSSASEATAQATSAPELSGRNTAAGDAHDIEQFTAWLEGLKKK